MQEYSNALVWPPRREVIADRSIIFRIRISTFQIGNVQSCNAQTSELLTFSGTFGALKHVGALRGP